MFEWGFLGLDFDRAAWIVPGFVRFLTNAPPNGLGQRKFVRYFGGNQVYNEVYMDVTLPDAPFPYGEPVETP